MHPLLQVSRDLARLRKMSAVQRLNLACVSVQLRVVTLLKWRERRLTLAILVRCTLSVYQMRFCLLPLCPRGTLHPSLGDGPDILKMKKN